MRAGLEERQALRDGDPVLSEATVVAAKSGWEAAWRRKREPGEALGGLVVPRIGVKPVQGGLSPTTAAGR